MAKTPRLNYADASNPGLLSAGAQVIPGVKTFPAAPVFNAGMAVDTNTFVVDDVNNRVGIGTATPTTALDVAGAAKTSGSITTTDLFLHSSANGFALRASVETVIPVGASNVMATTGRNNSGGLIYVVNENSGEAGLFLISQGSTTGTVTKLVSQTGTGWAAGSGGTPANLLSWTAATGNLAITNNNGGNNQYGIYYLGAF